MKKFKKILLEKLEEDYHYKIREVLNFEHKFIVIHEKINLLEDLSSRCYDYDLPMYNEELKKLITELKNLKL